MLPAWLCANGLVADDPGDDATVRLHHVVLQGLKSSARCQKLTLSETDTIHLVDAVVEALVDFAGEVPVQVDAVEPLELAYVLVINLAEYKIGRLHCPNPATCRKPNNSYCP